MSIAKRKARTQTQRQDWRATKKIYSHPMQAHAPHCRLKSVIRREALLFVALVVPSGRPAIEIKGFKMVESRAEKRVMELRATIARVFKPENLMALDKLRANIWGQMKKPYQVSGLVGVIDSNSQDFQIHRASEVISPDGYIFKTENLLYSSSQRTLTTDDIVEAHPASQRKDSSLKIVGRGLFINLNKGTYDIKKNVKAEQQLSKTNTLTIHSAQAVITPEQNEALFQRNVTVKSPTLELVGERLVIRFSGSADPENPAGPSTPRKLLLDSPHGREKREVRAKVGSLEIKSKGLMIDLASDGAVEKSEALGNAEGVTEDGVHLHADTLISEIYQNRQRILMKNNVHIVTDTRDATCQDAQYFPDTGEVVLEKVATVKNGTQLIEGDVIRYSTKGSEITVEKAKGQMDRHEVMKEPTAPRAGG